MTTVRRRSSIAVSPRELFDFHRDPRNLARISPPLPRLSLISPAKETEAGDEQRLRLSVGPFSVQWLALITRFEPPTLLEDTQLRGPFRAWRHRHEVAAGPSGSVLTDRIQFRLFAGPAAPFLDWLIVAPALRFLLWWRHRETRRRLSPRQGTAPGTGVASARARSGAIQSGPPARAPEE